ncbi:MAG TPA: zinc-binding dehydrogenase [Actinophytocola sp.]|uniref:quinone oxidoreductase family protein n=1 Tax=Actinophytocola sp. TaxID=1872138 RepID=UPI002F94A321
MRRVRYHEYGGPEVLRVEEAEVPEPGPGQVCIRVSAIGANFVDAKFRRGAGAIFQRPLPATLTGDVVGTVEAVGTDADPGLAGRRVAALSPDAFADQVLADVADLVVVPDGLDDAAASMLPSAAPVALGTLLAGGLTPGATVLVHAAAGNIGHLATQLAKLRGAGTVIGTAGSPAKLDFVRAHGADVAVDYTDDAWPNAVRAAAPGGVDVVLDSVGGTTTLRGVELLAPFGRLVVYGAAQGVVDVPVRSLYTMRSVTGFSLLAWQKARPAEYADAMTELAGLLGTGKLRYTVHIRLPLAEAAEAHRLLDARAQLGRILLVP